MQLPWNTTDWAAASEVHRLSGLMALAILIQIPYRIYCLRTGRLPFGTRAPGLFGGFLIAALFLNWAVGVARMSQRDRPPPTVDPGSEQDH